MKHTITLISLVLCSTFAHAELEFYEAQKTVSCSSNIKELINEVTGPKYKEYPIWGGNESSTDSKYSIFVNEKTRTWTLVQFNDTTVCVLGNGDASVVMLQKKELIKF